MRFTRFVPLLAVILGFAAPLPAQETTPASQLHELLERAWQFQLAENPLLASRVGDRRFDGLLGRVGVAEEQRRTQATREFLADLQQIEASAFAGQDLISYEMFDRQLRDAIGDFEQRHYYLPLTVDSGFHTWFASLPRFAPGRTVADYESYISRLRAFSALVDQYIALLREAVSEGFSLPRVVLEGYEVTIESHVVDDIEKSVFFAPFASYRPGVPEEERSRLTREGRAAIQEAVIPAYARFLAFFLDEYRPGARETLGASALPDGAAYYQHLIHRFTTLDLTADQVHEIGLGEVARIHREMELVIEEVGFDGSFASFLEFLRTDPRFYVDTPEALLTQARSIAKRMDGQLPALFRTLPRQPYGVEPVPDHLAPKYTGGRYVGAPLDSTRGGTYWVNTYALPSRPLYTLEALTLHEAVPGHHLQNALRQELQGLPAFRRYGGVGAYGEGWGLYSERLGLEAGFYKDPYSNFGRLTYEMWRACRLVVDTGIHTKGWTREQTMEYLASNTALSLHEIRTETDRYIAWPGQALGYKLGELKIRELRKRAEDELGAGFDLRNFHDVVLLNGPVPLPVLERLVDEWIAAGGVVNNSTGVRQ